MTFVSQFSRAYEKKICCININLFSLINYFRDDLIILSFFTVFQRLKYILLKQCIDKWKKYAEVKNI